MRGHSPSPFWCLSEAFSVPFYTLIKLCYTKALEWSSLGPWSRCYIFLGDHESNIVHCKLSVLWDLHGLAFATPKQWLGNLHLGRPMPSPSTWPGAWAWVQKRSGLSPCPMAPWGGQEGKCPCPSLTAPFYVPCSRGLLPSLPRNQEHSSMEVCKLWGLHTNHELE